MENLQEKSKTIEMERTANKVPYAIETIDLTKRYGRQVVVDHLNMTVPQGSVFGFLGRNGAGKTTTIQMLLDILDRTSGDANILGLDTIRDALEIKSRVGYVADGQTMYDWMKVDEIIWFCKGFYANWDDLYVNELKKKLELPSDKKLSELSKGTQAKVALLLAMAYHPELLILDEPTAGLDVIVRRDFLEGVIEMIQEEGRTVFFSSHIVHEVERVADWIGIIDRGTLISCSPIEELKESVRRIVLTLDTPPASFARIPGVLSTETAGRQHAIIVRDFNEITIALAKTLKPVEMYVEHLSLEDIFVALVGKSTEE